MRLHRLAAVLIGMAVATPSLAQVISDPNAAAAVQSAHRAAHAAREQALASRHDRFVEREAEAAGDYRTADAARRAARFHAYQAHRAAHVAGYERHVAGAEISADRGY